ncbi:hypothetical protein CLOP_g1003 [Closterium sp. NIES-67]|nr:hypothetical protein CLOP_g1003 [Closterium sp. NIES-67]
MVERRRDSCRPEESSPLPLETSHVTIRPGSKRQQPQQHHNAEAHSTPYFPKSPSYKARFGMKPNLLRAAVVLTLIVAGSAVALWSLGLSFRSALLAIQPPSSRMESSALDGAGARGGGDGRDINALSADQLAIALSLRQLGKPRRPVKGAADGNGESAGNAREADAAASARAADDGTERRADGGGVGRIQGDAGNGVVGGEAAAATTGEETEAESDVEAERGTGGDGHVVEQQKEGDSEEAGGAADDAVAPPEGDVPPPDEPAVYRSPVILGKLPKPGTRRAVALRNILQFDVIAANTTSAGGRSKSSTMLVPARPTKTSEPQDGFQALRKWLSKRKKRMLRDESAPASRRADKAQATDFPVLLLTHCLPPPSIFHCRHLVASLAGSWLFAIPPPAMRARLRNAPVGTCQLYPTPPRLPPSAGIETPAASMKKQAWATVLHSSDKYICGALALARSLRRVGTRHELVAFVSKEVSQRAQRSLKLAGWKVVAIGRMRSSFKASSNYCKWNHSKLRLWQFSAYSKLVFLDTDMLVLRNLDHLFAMPELTAVANNQFQFNGGLLVVDPEPCTFSMLKDALALFETYSDCEQGLLNELYPWWHRLPRATNFLKFVWSNDPEHLAQRRATLSAQPPIVDMVHYLGAKPWYCYRDFDCNLLSKERQFADDLAFDMWWKVHDEMSDEEQQQCWLPTWTKAALRASMKKMELIGEDPRLWNVTIADPRDNKCRKWEETYSCDWRTMQSVLDDPKHFRF